MKPWNELSRAEKIKSLFDYPDEMRDSQAKDLWGPDAYAYSNHIWFPVDAPWNEIVEIIKNSHSSHSVYVRLTYKDFKFFDYSGLNVPLVAVCNVPPIAFSNVPPQKWLL